jgi:hypothetical protein
MIRAVRLDSPCASVTVNSEVGSDVFCAYVREALVPALRPGDEVVDGQPLVTMGVRGA